MLTFIGSGLSTLKGFPRVSMGNPVSVSAPEDQDTDCWSWYNSCAIKLETSAFSLHGCVVVLSSSSCISRVDSCLVYIASVHLMWRPHHRTLPVQQENHHGSDPEGRYSLIVWIQSLEYPWANNTSSRPRKPSPFKLSDSDFRDALGLYVETPLVIAETHQRERNLSWLAVPW